ncbi:MAG: hypothetical protein IJX23_03320 [Clostridia bacterium]|nr:hypothetical protein [Clostridia bacterium]
MKKILVVLLVALLLVSSFSFAACSDPETTITVCASELPHADILNNSVRKILREKGYTLKVKVIDWEIQNDAVANADCDANYFQHTTYLGLYTGTTKLFAACKVHYEPLGIYKGGKYSENTTDNFSVAICNDASNALRALELLKAKGYISSSPDLDADEKGVVLKKSIKIDNVTINLIAENLLVPAMADSAYVCLPANTALTGRVDQSLKIHEETDPDLVLGNANILAARIDDYKNDPSYKAKIDALVDALLSEEVAKYVAEKFDGAVICDERTQIDLRPGK